MKQLKRMHVVEQKQAQEGKFDEWANSDPSKKAVYGNVTALLKKAYSDLTPYAYNRAYFGEAIIQGPEILLFSYNFKSLATALADKLTSKDEINKITAELKKDAEEYFKDYYEPIDRKLYSKMLSTYSLDIPKEQQCDLFKMVESKYKGNFEKYADDVFRKSIFTSLEKVNAFLAKPSAKKITSDPAFKAITSFFDFYNQNIRGKMAAIESDLNSLNLKYIKGTREMNPGKKYYPDANSTMRLTYGKVKAYDPADAIKYNWFTTIEGVMEKMDNSNPEFEIKDEYVNLFEKRDFGQYAENGTLRVCFISDNDITGGNSGSGVMDGEGNLIGIAFDGNWEAMSGDIAFDSTYKRTISTDIRYVLWVIEKIGKAHNLIEEMTLIR